MKYLTQAFQRDSESKGLTEEHSTVTYYEGILHLQGLNDEYNTVFY
jgi:hypothetical protein